MSLEDKIEKQLSNYESKIKKILFQEKLDRFFMLIMYGIGTAAVVMLLIALNKH